MKFKNFEFKLDHGYLNICFKKTNQSPVDKYYSNVLFLTNPDNFFSKKTKHSGQKQNIRVRNKILKKKNITKRSLFVSSRKTDFQLPNQVEFENKIKIYISKILSKKKEQISNQCKSNFFDCKSNFSFKNKNEFELILTLNKVINSLNMFFGI
ncbi:hypothetical protein CPARA_2gp224 (nucleomorph) [Cryptomonas paramecium]|uniref:Uncharacterized protein n=1 Tax=Cryptomonas paramaecium TaxID=2898 RepID=F2HHT6_9CRYP|nr:hypothetical protein CPARA_2gp224 [Cryptomonas paramecium]AEA38882.1 hypothetical protein CPARA_2gp224 [Cryptomonas paramecium]